MPPLDLRASDADRQVAVADLQRHYADGRLTTEELRERVGLAMAARTYSDLEELQRDLPRAMSVPETASAVACCPSPTEAQWRRGFRRHAAFYLLVICGLIIVWLLTTPGGYFWPVWPMFGWGMGLASHGIAYKLRSADTPKISAF
ncbi:MAG TPA: DUF1707 domain-containing protein [Chloroflexota bacterium]|jgi:hypothetical protein|nr:DUF1707 domain-containing protein [Chloroflexota bacterium]